MSQKSATKNSPKNKKSFFCKPCNYKCSRYSDLAKHKMTRKHQSATCCEQENSPKNVQNLEENHKIYNFMNSNNNNNNNITIPCETFICIHCGREYKSRSGKWRHERKCLDTTNIKKPIDNNIDIDIDSKIQEAMLKYVPAIAGKITNEVLTVTAGQNKELTDAITEQAGSIKIIAEKVGNNNNINSHNTQNNQFNINLFLNEQCKNAISMQEFIKKLTVDLDDLQYTVENGNVDGITNIIVRNLNELEVEERPIHCTDEKRNTFYIKDEDKGWSKDKEKEKLKKMVMIANQRYGKLIKRWTDRQPNNWMDIPHITDEFHRLVKTIHMCEKDEIKVMKNVAKEVIIDKNCIVNVD